MSLKKTIAILISIIFISSSVIASAQTTTSTSAKFTFLSEGDVAPFTGTLFSIEATAKLLAEKERSEQDDRSLSGSIRHLLKESDELRKLRER
mgnify:CR=1 FL=1